MSFRVLLSGMLAKKDSQSSSSEQKHQKTKKPNGDDSGFTIIAHDGAAKHMAEFEVPINDELITLGLQAHNLDSGIVKALKADRGGKVLVYQPNI